MARNSVQVQAWLHTQKDADACEVLQRYRNQGWKDRQIMRAALEALKMQTDAGWQPRQDVDVVYINSATLAMLDQMRALMARLSTLDLSSGQGVSNREFEQIKKEVSVFEQSASAMMGGAVFFDDEDR